MFLGIEKKKNNHNAESALSNSVNILEFLNDNKRCLSIIFQSNSLQTNLIQMYKDVKTLSNDFGSKKIFENIDVLCTSNIKKRVCSNQEIN